MYSEIWEFRHFQLEEIFFAAVKSLDANIAIFGNFVLTTNNSIVIVLRDLTGRVKTIPKLVLVVLVQKLPNFLQDFHNSHGNVLRV